MRPSKAAREAKRLRDTLGRNQDFICERVAGMNRARLSRWECGRELLSKSEEDTILRLLVEESKRRSRELERFQSRLAGSVEPSAVDVA